MAATRSIARAGPSGEDTGHLPPSYYAATVGAAVAAPALEGDIHTDHCVIGGGFAGLGAALALARAGQRVHLVEAGPIGWGASGRNGGQVHVGWQQDLPWLEARLGRATATALWQGALAARAHLDSLLALADDACDYRPGLIHADHRARDVPHTHAHVALMRETWGYDSLTALDRDALHAMLPVPGYHGGSFDRRGGHLHPLKLAQAMARAAQAAGAVLHAHTPCTALKPAGDGWRVVTPQGTITAGKVLDATGAYARALLRETDAHVLPVNNYIATTAPLDPALAHDLIRNGAAVSDGRFVVYYFRVTPDHRLLFGGGESYGYRMPRDIAAFVRPHLARVFPQLAAVPIDHAWGGTLAISPNRLPFVIEPHPGLHALNGFSGVGVVLAPWLGDAVGRAMAGEDNLGYDCLRRLPAPRFPGGPRLRWPTQALAMRFMALRDRF
jgi:gamma-glutamylputrescine oxidase